MANYKDENEKYMKDKNTCLVYDSYDHGYIYEKDRRIKTTKNRELAKIYLKKSSAQDFIKRQPKSRQSHYTIELYYLFDVLHKRTHKTGKWILGLKAHEKDKLFHIAA